MTFSCNHFKWRQEGLVTCSYLKLKEQVFRIQVFHIFQLTKTKIPPFLFPWSSFYRLNKPNSFGFSLQNFFPTSLITFTTILNAVQNSISSFCSYITLLTCIQPAINRSTEIHLFLMNSILIL